MSLNTFIKKYGIREVNPDIVRVGFIDGEKDAVRIYKLFVYKDAHTSWRKIITMMKEKGFRPATFGELLGWESWDRNSQVVAAGSTLSLKGQKYVPCLTVDYFSEPTKYYSVPRLALLNTEMTWTGEVAFLGVK